MQSMIRKFHIFLFIFAAVVGMNSFAQIQTVTASNPSLRLIGTNLFDMSQAGPAFHIIGEVTKIYPQSVEVSIPVAQGFRLKADAGAGALYEGSGEMLRTLYGLQAGTNPDGSLRLISAGQLLAMSPELRAMYEPATEYNKYYLLNAKFAQVGQTLNATVVPTINPGFYDCGVQFTGDTNDFKLIYRLVGDQIIKTPVLSSTNAAPALERRAPKSVI
jgi:hypothetical protein